MVKPGEKRCDQNVYDAMAWQWNKCQRAAGHGEDGLYCKQHAKKHPSAAEVQAGKWMYWAEWGRLSSGPDLARVLVIAETETTFTAAQVVNLVGDLYIKRAIRKGDGYLSEYLEDACEYIEKEATRRVSLALAQAAQVERNTRDVREQVKAARMKEVAGGNDDAQEVQDAVL